ncbi:fumarylacetoacetate hydrolase family protein [uncultured Alsobacter sp.]|uniref:fumarylacetoacetate hydrolase family protein n=1 Tax=uncultured Alsobacter sp. TaxID=1748258 RepID=UPI0025E92103|nr:fumarylacetoacetate hydrolase family protein [uncultured Alsobacter sp.]
MKLATFVADARSALGVVDTVRGEILDLARAGQGLPAFSSMLALIDAGPEGLAQARRLADAWPREAVVPLAGTRLLAPLPEPRQFRDGMFFEEHVRNAGRRVAEAQGLPPPPVPAIWYERPIYYLTSRFAVGGPDTVVTWPSYSKVMDFELELACVLGRSGRDIPAASAMEHVFGYTIFNDLSARDTQGREMQGRLGPSKGKNFDGSNVLGPWIVTADEIGDPYALAMEARVNGERWGGGSSGSMHHKWADVIAFISSSETLHAGEIIGSGTVGTGCGLELNRFLKDGDVVELDIERIGVLRTTVVTAA